MTDTERYRTIIEWALGEDTGRSSKALARHMVGIKNVSRHSAPSDSDDRGRCIRLLNLIPEWWDRLDEMALYPSSKVTHWSSNGFEVKEEGWKEQIPLIRQEAKL